MEKKIETTIVLGAGGGVFRTTIRIHSFIPCQPEVRVAIQTIGDSQ